MSNKKEFETSALESDMDLSCLLHRAHDLFDDLYELVERKYQGTGRRASAPGGASDVYEAYFKLCDQIEGLIHK